MMGKMQKRKGYMGEHEVEELLNDLGIEAKRIPMSGATGYQKDDIMLPDKGTIEVKRRKKISKFLQDMLNTADYGILRGDREEWIVLMRVKEFAYIYKRYWAEEQRRIKELKPKEENNE
jgi:hypothetical protein